MEIKVLASGSSGNAYYVSDGTPLLLDAGIPFKEIQRGLGFAVSTLQGALLSHAHNDHSKAGMALAARGVDIYCSAGTMASSGISGHRVHAIKAHEQFTIGTWEILPFETVHDVAEPLGFLLANRSGEKLLYATDTSYLRYKFVGLTHLLIECNYSAGILRENVESGAVALGLKKRVMRSHMNLETLCDFLKANDLSQVREIHLLHLSDGNSDAEGFVRTVRELIGKPVYAE